MRRSAVAAVAVALAIATALVDVSAPNAKPVSGAEIAATGDVTLGRAGVYPPGGAERLLAGVRNLLRAPISLGNLETTLVDPGASSLVSKCGVGSIDCHAFSAPERFAYGLRRVGFTAFTVANNHSNDYGAAGRLRTLAALERAGLRSTGGPAQITVVNTGAIRVALVGFAPYATSANLLDLSAARRLVRSATKRAEVVVVTMHLGAEGTDRTHVPRGSESYLGEARGDARAFSHAVVAAGADLVVGHGPHVLRGMEWYRGRLIAYSLGNFSGYHTFEVVGPLAYGAVLRVKLDERGRFVRGRLEPVRLVASGTPTPDPLRTSVALVRRLSREDFGATAVRLDADGGIG